jgi:phage shock protein E
MDWTLILIVGGVVAAVFLLKRLSFVSAAIARKHLAEGALVIDVRSPEEFRSSKVPGAINLPLGEVRDKISARVKDKQQPLLVHCLERRSQCDCQTATQRLGLHEGVFNLGSLSRAQHIFAEAKQGKVAAGTKPGGRSL